MIVGVGTDLVEVARIRRAVDDPRTGSRFRARVFTAAETDYCSARASSAESFAARFAAKEAVMKALGTGFPQIAWTDIEVVREGGAPFVRLHGRAARRAESLGVKRWHLSLAHAGGFALAFVTAENVAGGPAGGSAP
jgi:holo-[acyl-carrier protein] synthase